MAHCDLAMPKHCLQGTVMRITWRNLLIKKKKRKYSFTKKFLVLLKLKRKSSPTLAIAYTKRWIRNVKANRGCIKLVNNAILSSPLSWSWKPVQEQQRVSVRNLTPQSQRGRWGRGGREWNEMCPLEANLASNALRLLTLRKPKTWVTEGCEVPHVQKTFFSFCFLTLLHFYWFTQDLNRYISFDITQPTSTKIYNWRCWICV